MLILKTSDKKINNCGVTGMRKLVIGILAHVDAGKTTLSEGLLYAGGSIRKIGRVDNKDAFLDNFQLEKARGITIFSKQAQICLEDCDMTLLDTPGHVDFSAEMERTLQVLDYAILVISGADGVQGHTQTLWRLLEQYQIPVFLFINKMDQNGTDKEALLAELKARLASECVDFSQKDDKIDEFMENVAVCDENVLEDYLEQGSIPQQTIKKMIADRRLFPCCFGSALKFQGVEEFLNLMKEYTLQPEYSKEFGARVFKIARDEQGNRLTYMKITGGSLKTKDSLTNAGSAVGEEVWSEKVNQIRIYSGEKFTVVSEAAAGTVCAVTGLTRTYPGQGLGVEAETVAPFLEPVLTYCILLPPECDPAVVLPKLKQLEEEEPQLHIAWNEKTQQIQVQVMGEVQIEILKSLILDRFEIEVEFGMGSIVYKETISNTVEGVGHFEPLRHYAEVHLLLEPLARGSGLVIDTDCSEEMLDRNWQRLILTHLYEKEHIGVLTGSAITDMKITLCAGRAHQKHTEGGDFRQATYRAVRQGLMQAESVLLEPFYEYRLEVPEAMVGRAMSDIERMYGTFEIQHDEQSVKDAGGKPLAVLIGQAPVAAMKDYYKEVISYTKGHGRLFCNLKGYEVCHNQEEVIAAAGYEAERDLENPADSVFCAHGSGFTVRWDQVPEYMHLESILKREKQRYEEPDRAGSRTVTEEWLGVEEIDEILRQTYYANKRDQSMPRKGMKKRTKSGLPTRIDTSSMTVRTYHPAEKRKEYLLVDGYNIIFAWKELNELAAVNLDSARGRLLDILCNYQGICGCDLIAVFDAYRVKGHETEVLDYHNIHVVYTKEAETADAYIEKFAHENGRKYDVTVATSDGLEQVIIRGQGCRLISAREFEEEVQARQRQFREEYLERQPQEKIRLKDTLSDNVLEQIQNLDKKHL